MSLGLMSTQTGAVPTAALVATTQVNGALTEKAVLRLKSHPYIVKLYFAFQVACAVGEAGEEAGACGRVRSRAVVGAPHCGHVP
eukprot:2950785-Prymnesium_polylepis.1